MTGKIRKATEKDASRLAEILVFSKRMNYRAIFRDDAFSFGEMQVLPLAQEYAENQDKRKNVFVYDDGFVKGMIHIEGAEIAELYVDSFFTGMGVGAALIAFAKERFNVRYLWVLEQNERAIRFYRAHGFERTGDRMREEGTDVFSVKMER